MSDTSSNPAHGERTYWLKLSLSGESHRVVTNETESELRETHGEDVRLVEFGDGKVEETDDDDLPIIDNTTAELFGSDMAERLDRHKAYIPIAVYEGLRQRHHLGQLGEILIPDKPSVSLYVSPVLFQHFWEAAVAPDHERPKLLLRAEKVSVELPMPPPANRVLDQIAITEVRLTMRPTTHPVVVAIDERIQQLERAIRSVAIGLGVMIGIAIALSLLILLSR